MSKNQFTGTATQLQCHRNFCQFNNDQYCTAVPISAYDDFENTMKNKSFAV